MSNGQYAPSLAGQYLTFAVGDEAFGMSVRHIREIIEFSRLTRVPMVPDTIRGVMNLRGNVVPVIDLSARLGRGRSRPGQHTSVVIAGIPADDGRETTLGVMVDMVHEVLELDEREVKPPPPFGGGIRTSFIAAMGRRNGAYIILLDAETVLAVDELARFSPRQPDHATVATLTALQAIHS